MIEVKELNIKITVVNNTLISPNKANEAQVTPALQKQIIQDCVEQVLEILASKSER